MNVRRKKALNVLLIVTLIVIAGSLFLPLFTVQVVPEWEINFVDKEGDPVPSVFVDEVWRHYSLEYLYSAENVDSGLQSDESGFLRLPARIIKVSAFQIVSAPIRDLVAQIIPHSSFGPDGYVLCRGKFNCLVSFDPKAPKPQRVVVR